MPVVVGPEAIDEMGHANNVETLRWVEAVGRAHLEAVGFPLERLFSTGGAFVARRHEIEYLRPTFLGDRLTVRTRIEALGGARSVREVSIVRGEEETARSRTEWAFVDLATGRPRRVPEEIRAAFDLSSPPDPLSKTNPLERGASGRTLSWGSRARP